MFLRMQLPPVVTAVFLSSFSLAIAAQKQADLLIRHATVVDVAAGRLVQNQAIATSGNRIVAVGNDGEISKTWTAKRTVQARDRYVIPGLWDMHVHFGGGQELVAENQALLPLYVAHGITTVRDASGDLPYDVLRWREAIAAGTLAGPTLLSSGPKLEGLNPFWKGTLEVGSAEGVDAAIARLRGLHVDFVKITDSTLKPDLFLHAVERARKAGFRTSGHIPMGLTVRQAVDAGLHSIEHLGYAYNAGVKDEAVIASSVAAGQISRSAASARLEAGFDEEWARRSYRYLAEKNVFVSPTLNGSRIHAFLDKDSHEKDGYLAFIGPGIRKTYEWRVQRAAQASPERIAQRHAQFDRVAAILPLLQKAGVTIMAGTDAGFLNSFVYPGIGLHEEIALYVERGLTPAQALASVVHSGPAWFGKLDQYGSIEQGKVADMVILRANPLTDIRATKAIDGVVLRGTLHDRAALDSMLTRVRNTVAAWNKKAEQ